jgi:sec-independent protein translocase protein TatB
MMDIGSTELLMIVIVAIVVIGPKDLPRALYKVGQVIGKAKGMARHFRSGIDAMVREVELEEMEKKWKADNERIMREYAAANPSAAPVAASSPTPAPEPAPAMEPLPEAPASLAAPAAPAAPVTEGER